MKPLTGRDIIEKGIMTEDELHYAFKTGEITPLDQNNNYQPINWEKQKAVFQEICEFAEQPGKHYPKPGIIKYSAGVNSDGFHKETRNTPRRTAEHERLVRDNQKTARIPEKTLLAFLRDESRQTRLSPSQYDEIRQGWGATQEKRILLDARFDKKEIEQITAKDKPPYLRPDLTYYCPELAALVETWLAFYHEKTAKLIKNEAERETIKEWMMENCPDLDPKGNNLEGKNAYLLKILNNKKAMKRLYDDTFPGKD